MGNVKMIGGRPTAGGAGDRRAAGGAGDRRATGGR